MELCRLRPYRDQDLDACLALFDSNVPKYFAESEREDFASFLEKLPGPYFVIENEHGSILACGGYATGRENKHVAVLCWGMVHQGLHRAGVGTRLLVERLRRIGAEPQISVVTIETSQHSRGFFERFGFAVAGMVPDGFAPGLNLVKMELDVALASIRNSCPDLALDSVQTIGSGQNNEIKLVNSELIFRFPKHTDGISRLKQEIDILDFIAERVPLKVPRPLQRNLDSEGMYRPFLCYAILAGTPLEADRLQTIGDDSILRRLAGQLADFLRQLHGIDPGVLLNEQIQSFAPYAEWADLYERIRIKLYPHLTPEARQRTDHHFGRFLEGKTQSPIVPTLIHGDFGTSNILYDQATQRISGILDFDEAGLGDPAVDYAALRASYGESFFQLLIAEDSRLPRMMDRVLFYQGTFALQEALFGLEYGDTDAFQAGLETVNMGG